MQFASTIVSIVLNNVLWHYGELSRYGRDIPLACVGIITKVCALFDGIALGIAQSIQPIIGYNYGAGNYDRIREAFGKVARVILCISCTAFLCFQLFPRQIISIFGEGDELYFDFAVRAASRLLKGKMPNFNISPTFFKYFSNIYFVKWVHQKEKEGSQCWEKSMYLAGHPPIRFTAELVPEQSMRLRQSVFWKDWKRVQYTHVDSMVHCG